MLLLSLILVPILGTLMIFIFYSDIDYKTNENTLKVSALIVTILDLFISLIIWFLFDNSCKYFQFVQEHYTIGHYDFYLGLDGLSIYLDRKSVV